MFSIQPMKASWAKFSSKPDDDREPVTVLGFMSCSMGDNIKPVAVIHCHSDNSLRYTELKFLKVEG